MRIVGAAPESIAEAGQLIASGELVIIPTETVYGLACDAMNEAAVQEVFKAKGRPLNNPLIVHIAELEQLNLVAEDTPMDALQLAQRFWPGPLTLVLKKSLKIPSITTAGLETVAVRMPDHPVALDIIRAAGTPVAAPSANLFTELSPTRVSHLNADISHSVALVVDGGSCAVGIESTVIDLTRNPFALLRRGAITMSDLEAVGVDVVEPSRAQRTGAPGQFPKHYAPRTPVVLVERLTKEMPGLVLTGTAEIGQLKMPEAPGEYQAILYQSLFELDQLGLAAIYVECPPEQERWAAVLDRLRRASHS